MKSWFSHVRFSLGLATPAERDQAGLERELKATVPRPEPPPGFGGHLMRAVRARQHAAEERKWPVAVRWLPAPIFAAAFMVAITWVASHRALTPATPTPGAAIMEMGHGLMPQLPGSFIEPLTGEWANLNRDLDRASDFLLASLP